MRVLLSVEESAGIQTIRAAQKSGHDIVAVLSSMGQVADDRRGATVEATAAHFGYPVWPSALVKDPAFAKVVREHAVDLFLNVHSLHVVHPDVLSAVRVGAFNLHPGPLPRCAGMNAPGWAIINDEPNHGVTLHWMESGIDTGPIAYETMFDLTPNDTGLSISSRCSRLGLKLVEQLLAADPDEIPRRPQDLSERRYHGFEIPFENQVPWSRAVLVERFVRACAFHPLPSPWGVPSVSFGGGEFGMIQVSATEERSDAPAGTVVLRNQKYYVAADDYWIELKRVLIDSKVVPADELPAEALCM